MPVAIVAPPAVVPKDISVADLTTAELLIDKLVQIRAHHEPLFVANAVRRSTRSIGDVQSSGADTEEKSSNNLRQDLMRRLATLTYEAVTQAEAQSSGVTRQVRHAGSYQAGIQQPSSTRERQKKTLQAVTASVSL